MKANHLVFLLGLPLAATATEIRPGDTLAEVRATLGAPRGQLLVAGRQLLYYGRGEIELQSGAVTRVALLTVEEHAVREARLAAIAARVREEQETRRARLIAEGEALKVRKLADPSFVAAPFATQVAFWEEFARRYPGVPSTEQLAGARRRLTAQLEEKRARELQEARLADLSARLLAAEARAARHRSYAAFGRDHRARHPFTFWPVEYQFYRSPLPYAASPSRYAETPVVRADWVPVFSERRDGGQSRHEWRESRGPGHHSRRDDRT